MDRLRCRQFRIRDAVDRSRANLRKLAAAVRRPIEYRVDMGVRADHRVADHRGDDACAWIHGRRAGHEGEVLYRILPDGRGRLLCDGVAAQLARFLGGVHSRHGRPERFAHVLRFHAGRYHVE